MRSFILASLALVSVAIAAPSQDSVLGLENPMLKIKRDPLYQEGLAIVERQTQAAQLAEGLTKRDVQARSLHKRQLEAQSCGLGPAARSQICRTYVTENDVTLPRDSYANCNQNTGFCRLKCRNGFTLSQGVCVQNVGNCPPEVLASCPPRPRNGVYTCPFGSTCKLICLYGRTPINGQCVDTKFDPSNCGGVGCPPAYNGIGTPACCE
ncbi:hypothetical protein OIO90_003230 [Microbotryomycetes sp. JL221]|nr:hypothetical protein OIO90_003230 [Microbotryomycetes sp. JL221]